MNERKTMLIYAEPTRDEIIKWANTALRNSDIGFIDESLIEDFKDGLSAFVATGQLVPAQTWQPIATAPKDGTTVHVISTKWQEPLPAAFLSKEYFLKEYEDPEYMEEGWYPSCGFLFDLPEVVIIPTHWMHLPAAPAPGVG